MPRISLVEAYNNRDVVAWLVRHQDAIDEMMNILQNINPDGDLTNIVLKTGDQTIDGVKTFIGKIVANCDIIQNGAAYETHAEQIFTKNDYIVMRNGALGGLQPGEFSGFRINRYDSVHDGHLVIDSSGTARVGDVGDERPLLVRDEAADLAAGDVLLWDSVDQKAIGQAKDSAPTSGSSACVTSDGIYAAFQAAENGVTTNTQSSISVTAGTPVHGLATVTVPSDGTYLVVVNTDYTLGSPSWMRAGVSKGGTLLKDVMNNYAASTGTFSTAGVLVASFVAGDVVGTSYASGTNGTLAATTTIVKLK